MKLSELVKQGNAYLEKFGDAEILADFQGINAIPDRLHPIEFSGDPADGPIFACGDDTNDKAGNTDHYVFML